MLKCSRLLKRHARKRNMKEELSKKPISKKI
jgi:hypothetical protein